MLSLYFKNLELLIPGLVLLGGFWCEATAMDVSRKKNSTESLLVMTPSDRLSRSPSMQTAPVPIPNSGAQPPKEHSASLSASMGTMQTAPVPIPNSGAQPPGAHSASLSASTGTINSKLFELLSPRSGDSGAATPKGKSPPPIKKGVSFEKAGMALKLICNDYGFNEASLGLPTQSLLKIVLALHEDKRGQWPTLDETIEAIQTEVRFGTEAEVGKNLWESIFEDRHHDLIIFNRLKKLDIALSTKPGSTEYKLAKAIQSYYIYGLLSRFEILELVDFEKEWEELLTAMYGKEKEGEDHGSLEVICKEAIEDPNVNQEAKKWLGQFCE